MGFILTQRVEGVGVSRDYIAESEFPPEAYCQSQSAGCGKLQRVGEVDTGEIILWCPSCRRDSMVVPWEPNERGYEVKFFTWAKEMSSWRPKPGIEYPA